MHGHQILEQIAAIILVPTGSVLVARAWRARMALAAAGDQPSRFEAHRHVASASRLQAIAAAALALAAAVIYFAVASEHMAEGGVYGATFMVLAAGYVAAAVGILLFGARRLRLPISALALAALAIWGASRTPALPVLPAPWALEPLGMTDFVATVLVAALVGVAIAPAERLAAGSHGTRVADALSIAEVPFIGVVGITTLVALASIAPIDHH